MKPKILIVTASRWFSTARLAMAMAHAGFGVDLICPLGHPVAKTSSVDRLHAYSAIAPLRSIKNAIQACTPDLLISGDDLASQHLHALYREASRRGNARDQALCTLIQRSLGDPESFPIVYRRAAINALAKKEGIAAPETRVISGFEDLGAWIARNGFPFALKVDRTSGGTGVKIVHNSQQAENSFRRLQAPPSLKSALRQVWSARDGSLLAPSLLRRPRTVNAQAFVAGREATSTVVCWQGEILAGLHFEVLKTDYTSGPATVVRLIDNAEMASAAEKIVRRLHLSGLHGFDFMLEQHSGEPCLLEMNPRATQAGHLSLGEGRDLPAALYAVMTDTAVRVSLKITGNDTIAYFPQEWLKDPASPFLKVAYHDVPWEEPDFVRACVGGPDKPIPQRPQPTRVSSLSSAPLHRA